MHHQPAILAALDAVPLTLDAAPTMIVVPGARAGRIGGNATFVDTTSNNKHPEDEWKPAPTQAL